MLELLLSVDWLALLDTASKVVAAASAAFWALSKFFPTLGKAAGWLDKAFAFLGHLALNPKPAPTPATALKAKPAPSKK